MAAAVLLLVPVGLLFVNWQDDGLGAIELRAPMLFALGAISTLAFGLASELGHAVIPVNWLLADTMDRDCRDRLCAGRRARAGRAGGLHYWFPKLTGRLMGESLAKFSLAAIIVGAQLTFLPMALAGIGQPVDAFKFYEDSVYDSSGTGLNVVVDTYQSLDLLNLLITIGAVVLAIGIVASLVNAALSASGRQQGRAGPVAR